jgi:nuclear GTP-binding protein
LIDCPGIVPTSAKDSQTSTVLKGVVRVEALATPSEHISALLERVKPIYLSRTYGVPLPDPDDPSKSWDYETLLDQLARMKGRLLKGGEPDLDSVAKIILSDWVRGRIPYFVPPPERPEALNKAEAKAAGLKVADAKGKGKAMEAEKVDHAIGVKQNFGSIMQKNTFISEDIKSLREDDVDADADNDANVAEVPDEDEDQEEEGRPEEASGELAWSDVFPSDGTDEHEEAPTVFSKLESDGDLDDSGDSSFRMLLPLEPIGSHIMCFARC